MLVQWETVDLRDEFAAYEREYRRWPRAGSVSKPYRQAERAEEEFERWHVVRMRLPESSLRAIPLKVREMPAQEMEAKR